MKDLKRNTKYISDLECDIYDIKSLEDFSKWIEHARSLTSSIWGESSEQYKKVKNTKRHYKLLPLESKFDLGKMQADAFEIIEVCNEGLV